VRGFIAPFFLFLTCAPQKKKAALKRRTPKDLNLFALLCTATIHGFVRLAAPGVLSFMRPFRLIPVWSLLFLLGLLALAAWASPPTDIPPTAEEDTPLPEGGPVRLAVLVVFDQLRGDYLTRWDGLFGAGGFHRLEKQGAWFQNCHYPYAGTVTAAGHASIFAGCSPATHGIVDNEWRDRASGQEVYCVGSERYLCVPPVPAETDKDGQPKKLRGVSPERLLAPTLGDALKQASGGKGRVVSLSCKDRSAVLPAGQHPDACYWFEPATGNMVTSVWYRDQVHPWVAEFNAARVVDRWFNHDWTRLRPGLDYSLHAGPDDVPGEGKGIGQGRTFPHPMTGGQWRVGKGYYNALFSSPSGNDLLLDLAKRAIDAEQLGLRDTPDLLSVSFSCNDPIGHVWGPDSHEVLDVTLRSDRVVKQLLDCLDARVGRGRYLVALTSDHGICPLPEVARGQGKEAVRVDPDLLAKQAEAFLDQHLGPNPAKARWLAAATNGWFHLNQPALRARGLAPAEVEAALANWLKQQPDIQSVYTRSELLSGLASDDKMGAMVSRSFYPDRCGDVAYVAKPYHLVYNLLTGTMHGTPHPYDTHAPLLVYGPTVRPGTRQEPVTPQACAAILAHALGIKPPAMNEYPVPEGLFLSD
jgi:hypothetical protein